MADQRWPAREFKAWLKFMQEGYGRRWSKSHAARKLGCGRNQILQWERDGSPWYIGLACRTLAEGHGPWREHRPAPRKKAEPEKALASIPWTKADIKP
jgi:hypothetical protein